jgi:prolyl-tRNA editing enzyme YbaK/EbsC (Cys-tRNA(Pro) deacylase)
MYIMQQELSASAQRVQRALEEREFGHCKVVELPSSTRTAQEAAQSIGCRVEQIVKSLIFRAKQSDVPILVVASGANRVNEQQLSALVGEPIEKAKASFVQQRTGFVIGGVPPLGHLTPVRTFVDQSLLQYDEIWAAAGTPFAVFRLTPQELVAMTGGEVIELVQNK